MDTTTAPVADPHALPAEDFAARLDVDPDVGLSDVEVAVRLARFGPNALSRAHGPSRLRRWLAQLHNPLVHVLLAAAVVTLAFGEYVDSGVIAGVVVLNAVIGYVQESRAQRALDALARMVRTEATVRRGGQTRRVPAEELVPGDVVLLAAGDRVPADIRLVDTHALEVNESALTGESVPVAKSAAELPAATGVADRTNMAHSGTLVTRGTGHGVVAATGAGTELGLIQRLVATTEPVATPLTRKLGGFSRQLSVGIVAVAALVFVVGIVRGTPVPEMFTAVVALAVGAIPEGLPAAVSIVLAIGVVRMARRNAVVRHLPAVETLGSTTVICTDKTGTLTANRMTVTTVAVDGRLYTRFDDPAVRECLVAGVLCNDATLRREDGRWLAEGDPTETALIVAAQQAGLDPRDVRDRAPRLDVLPFDSARRIMATAHGTGVGYVKGAVEEVLARCRGADPESVHRLQRTLAAQGLRVLAFARFTPGPGPLAEQVDRGGFTLLGLQAMHDPPREAAARAVGACRTAGIEVKMITGDHAETARSVAASVSLVDDGAEALVLTGAELDRLDEDRFDDEVAAATVFARVSPEQKLRLVQVFQRRGHIVAMTGDGVNDAPALRRADIGVAMGAGGTDAARQAADMVLVDDDFASIEAAVEEGRGVFDNVRKFIAWTLPTNIGEGMVILVAVLLGATLPIVPVQILWINMTTAVFLGLTMAFEPKEPGIMRRPPRSPDRPLLTSRLVWQIGLVSALLVVAAFLAYLWELAGGGSVAQARTTAVNVFVCVQVAYLFSCRVLDRPVLGARPGRNRMLAVGIGLTVALQLLFTYPPTMNALFHTAPIGWDSWLRVFAAGVLAFLVVEADKVIQGAVRVVAGKPRRPWAGWGRSDSRRSGR